MVYNAEISRRNPTCIIFLLDQSGSMSDTWGGNPGEQKDKAVADVLNKCLRNIEQSCQKEVVRDYFHIGVLGYGATVGPALGGTLAGRDLVPISEIVDAPRIEERPKKMYDGAGGVIEAPINFSVWVDPVAENGTPMCQALRYADGILTDWLGQHPQCYPPLVFNITDGMSTDGDPTPEAENIQGMASDDGNVLLFNLHISSSRAASFTFPASEAELPDEYAKLLFRISSPLPDAMKNLAQKNGYQISEGARGFVFNANIEDLIQFLEIGTKHDDRLR